MANSITVRIQSADHGTKRVQTKPTEKLVDFFEKIQQEFGFSNKTFSLYQNRNKTGQITSSRTKTVSSIKIKHGDMLYVSPDAADVEMADTPVSVTTTAANGITRTFNTVVEDDVDQYLTKQDGRIYRQRNEQMCHHGPSGKCFHCVPLEPYDETYLKSADPPIKFLSFHSYIRKLMGGVDKGKFVNLENISCKIKPGCTGHPPWPDGICTKCQPNAVTLNRQPYRHVDYVQFENPFVVEHYLKYWRNTGSQRMGFLYGRYEPHKELPLGIKAVVSAIYEPPQVSTRNSIKLLDDEKEAVVKEVAAHLGLVRIGWIFTDLIPEDLTKGTVKHFRGNINSHFLSAEECIMAAEFQNNHPNPCKLSPEGHFGSKFVTVVVTGDANHHIHFEGYQVSNQCMALVRDDCLIPTKDAPELGYVKESSNNQYVPDVFYKVKDEYGNEVTQLARPLPVEYLLLDLPAAFPVEPQFTFTGGHNIRHFPIENRADTGEAQNFGDFTTYISQFDSEQFLEAMSDFHLLIYLTTCDMLPLKGQMASLYEAVKNKDKTLAHHWSKTEEWGTVRQMMEAHAPMGDGSQGAYADSGTGSAANNVPTWTCIHCTFINESDRTSCAICALPQ